MQYRIHNYYRKFKCLADRCEDTCCAGWQIAIDEKSLGRYKNVNGVFGRRLRKSIHWRSCTFRQIREKRCAFLNEDNLCDMYLALGEKSLCRTCRMYPRHVEEFENVRELTLSISCPEAARILLCREEPTFFCFYEKEGTETYGDFDGKLYAKLTEGREVIRKILQNRDVDLCIRIGLVLGLAHDMQGRILRDRIEGCEEVFVRYQKERAISFYAEKRRMHKKDARQQYSYAKGLFRKLYGMELIHQDWDFYLRETEQILYGQGWKNYETSRQEFARWLAAYMPQWQIQGEQLFLYFIDTYFCGAVYDRNVYGKVQMAVGSMFLIYEMLLARWKKSGRFLDTEDVIRVVYRYSREIEHSDVNLNRMETFLRGKDFCLL